jgi:hypothetical protein
MQIVVARTVVDHGRIVAGDIGDVGRLVNDRHVALDRNNRALDQTAPEFIPGDECVLIRPDVVVAVRPISNTDSAI